MNEKEENRVSVDVSDAEHLACIRRQRHLMNRKRTYNCATKLNHSWPLYKTISLIASTVNVKWNTHGRLEHASWEMKDLKMSLCAYQLVCCLTLYCVLLQLYSLIETFYYWRVRIGDKTVSK